MRSIRNEADPFLMMMRGTAIQQKRYLASVRELKEAQNNCQRLMPYYQKIMGPRRLIASSMLTSEWLDTACMVCTVINPEKKKSKDASVVAKAETRVDLGALLAKDYLRACEKRCLCFDSGLCVHVIAGKRNHRASSSA